MPGIDVLLNGRVQHDRPAVQLDGQIEGTAVRLGSYGEIITNQALPWWQQLADEGSIYTASNATPGTAIQSDLITAFSTTGAGDCVIINTNPVTSQKRIYPIFIRKMLSGTAPATTTVQNFALFTDVTFGCIPSAGSVTLTPVTVDTGNVQGPSGALIYVPTGGAAMTIPATGGSRQQVGRAQLPTGLGVTGDVYTLYFGDALTSGTRTATTEATTLTTSVPPVVIDPGFGLIVDFWWLTQTTNKPQWEWEIVWIER